jgi:hypothetical protein
MKTKKTPSKKKAIKGHKPTRLAAPVCSALKRQILADVRDHGWLLADWITFDMKHAKAVDELLEAKKLTEWGLFIFEGERLVYFTLGRKPMDDRLRATLNWCEGWPNTHSPT